ncbi:MAG: D-alanyl-D-alanine carboxypeptidase [Ruminococcaceae bacterium]|nr:D-alanyl-D-alanine carboxypeptidase [Oscillospiraceae bacterium]
MSIYKKFISCICVITIFFGCLITSANDPEPEFNGRNIYVMDKETKRCLYEKNAYEKTPMASTTKIMTAIIVLEKGNLNDITIVSSNAAGTEGSSMNLKKGEEISVNDLLYGLLIKSGNDAAVALAEAISGSVEEFCMLMNEKAKSIGAYDTNFTSPHGLDDENHYTTARDLAIIAEYASNNKIFRQIVATKSTSVNGHYLGNTNDLLWNSDYVTGIKTGYTGKAGRCVVLSIEKDEVELIAVILGCNTTEERTEDGNTILNYFPGNYSVNEIIESGAVVDSIRCYKSEKKYISAIIKEPVKLCLSTEEKKNINFKAELYSEYENGIKKEIKSGTVLGIYYIYSGDKLLDSVEIVASENNETKGFLSYLEEYFLIWSKETFTALYK